MPMNKAVIAAFRAVSRLKPGARDFYKKQRLMQTARAQMILPDPHCRIDNIIANMPDGYGVPLRVFTPYDLNLSLDHDFADTQEARGTILFFHGAGYGNDDMGFYTDSCSNMALRLKRRVILVDYRRPPHYRFPFASEDCYEAARQLCSGRLISGAEDGEVVVMGDGVGGNLAAVVSLMARDRGLFTPSAQILLYPATYNDHNPGTTMFSTLRKNSKNCLLTAQDIHLYLKSYCSSTEDRKNPYFAPLISSSLRRQPPSLVITAEHCPLRDEGEVYAQRLVDDGGIVECYRMLDAMHGYLLYPAPFEVVKNTYRIVEHFLDGFPLQKDEEPAWLSILATTEKHSRPRR